MRIMGLLTYLNELQCAFGRQGLCESDNHQQEDHSNELSVECRRGDNRPLRRHLNYCGFTVHRHMGEKKAMNFRLVSAFTQNYRGGGLEKNSQVQPDGPISCVLQIQADHLIKSGAAATFHLPQTRDSRLDLKHSAAVPHIIRAELIRNRGPWTNQRHITAQDIPELGQLVQARFTNELAHTGYPGIFLNLEDRLLAFRRGAVYLARDELAYILLVNARVTVCAHRAELKNSERFAKLAQSFLLEEHRSL